MMTWSRSRWPSPRRAPNPLFSSLFPPLALPFSYHLNKRPWLRVPDNESHRSMSSLTPRLRCGALRTRGHVWCLVDFPARVSADEASGAWAAARASRPPAHNGQYQHRVRSIGRSGVPRRAHSLTVRPKRHEVAFQPAVVACQDRILWRKRCGKLMDLD